jgi:hypothetical protein
MLINNFGYHTRGPRYKESVRSISRDTQGRWTLGQGTLEAHEPRMRDAARRCASGRCGGRPVTYLESPDRRAFLVDTQKWTGASSEEEQRAAILYTGPVPQPAPEQLQAAYETLAAGGYHPEADHREGYARFVIGPCLPGQKEDLDFYERALTSHGQDLSPVQRAAYEGRLAQAGRR